MRWAITVAFAAVAVTARGGWIGFPITNAVTVPYCQWTQICAAVAEREEAVGITDHVEPLAHAVRADQVVEIVERINAIRSNFLDRAAILSVGGIEHYFLQSSNDALPTLDFDWYPLGMPSAAPRTIVLAESLYHPVESAFVPSIIDVALGAWPTNPPYPVLEYLNWSGQTWSVNIRGWITTPDENGYYVRSVSYNGIPLPTLTATTLWYRILEFDVESSDPHTNDVVRLLYKYRPAERVGLVHSFYYGRQHELWPVLLNQIYSLLTNMTWLLKPSPMAYRCPPREEYVWSGYAETECKPYPYEWSEGEWNHVKAQACANAHAACTNVRHLGGVRVLAGYSAWGRWCEPWESEKLTAEYLCIWWSPAWRFVYTNTADCSADVEVYLRANRTHPLFPDIHTNYTLYYSEHLGPRESGHMPAFTTEKLHLDVDEALHMVFSPYAPIFKYDISGGFEYQ